LDSRKNNKYSRPHHKRGKKENAENETSFNGPSQPVQYSVNTFIDAAHPVGLGKDRAFGNTRSPAGKLNNCGCVEFDVDQGAPPVVSLQNLQKVDQPFQAKFIRVLTPLMSLKSTKRVTMTVGMFNSWHIGFMVRTRAS
jgi:hypothetical protein